MGCRGLGHPRTLQGVVSRPYSNSGAGHCRETGWAPLSGPLSQSKDAFCTLPHLAEKARHLVGLFAFGGSMPPLENSASVHTTGSATGFRPRVGPRQGGHGSRPGSPAARTQATRPADPVLPESPGPGVDGTWVLWPEPRSDDHVSRRHAEARLLCQLWHITFRKIKPGMLLADTGPDYGAAGAPGPATRTCVLQAPLTV